MKQDIDDDIENKHWSYVLNLIQGKHNDLPLKSEEKNLTNFVILFSQTMHASSANFYKR